MKQHLLIRFKFPVDIPDGKGQWREELRYQIDGESAMEVVNDLMSPDRLPFIVLSIGNVSQFHIAVDNIASFNLIQG